MEEHLLDLCSHLISLDVDGMDQVLSRRKEKRKKVKKKEKEEQRETKVTKKNRLFGVR